MITLPILEHWSTTYFMLLKYIVFHSHVFDALNNKTLVANRLAAELTCGDTTTVSCIVYFHETAGEREPSVAVFKDFARISERCQPLVS